MLIIGKEATTTLLGDVRFWPGRPQLGDALLRPPTSQANLTYPSIKRYTHGNCKGMKVRHPASCDIEYGQENYLVALDSGFLSWNETGIN